MDKFLNPNPNSKPIQNNAFRVRGRHSDNESISESIDNSFYSKRGLPTLNLSGTTPTNPTIQQANIPLPIQTPSVSHKSSNNPLEDLLDKIDDMNDGFNEPDELSCELDEQDLELFKDNVKKWIQTDNSICELDKQRKELMKIRNSYNLDIIKFMKRYKADDVNIDNGEKIKFEVRHSKQGYNRKNLQEQINSYFIQNHDVAIKLLDYLETNRKINETEKIKRIKLK